MNSSSSSSLDRRALFYMAILAIQFGCCPIVTRRYTSPTIIRSTVVLIQEIVKFFIAAIFLFASGDFAVASSEWTISNWFTVAFIPAGLYAVQNIAALTASQNLDSLTFSVLNQTKTLSAALCCYIIMNKRQSPVQIGALLILLLSALVMEGIVDPLGRSGIIKPIATSDSDADSVQSARHFTHGVAPILLASFISGLAGALSQRNLQQSDKSKGRNALLFSMELCAASILILGFSLLVSSDGQQIQENGFWHGWTWYTAIPILVNATGGIIVGLVTKYAGSIRKGFALIFGIFLSGTIQALVSPEQRIESKHLIGGILAGVSLYLHATNPPKQHIASADIAAAAKKQN